MSCFKGVFKKKNSYTLSEPYSSQEGKYQNSPTEEKPETYDTSRTNSDANDNYNPSDLSPQKIENVEGTKALDNDVKLEEPEVKTEEAVSDDESKIKDDETENEKKDNSDSSSQDEAAEPRALTDREEEPEEEVKDNQDEVVVEEGVVLSESAIVQSSPEERRPSVASRSDPGEAKEHDLDGTAGTWDSKLNSDFDTPKIEITKAEDDTPDDNDTDDKGSDAVDEASAKPDTEEEQEVVDDNKSAKSDGDKDSASEDGTETLITETVEEFREPATDGGVTIITVTTTEVSKTSPTAGTVTTTEVSRTKRTSSSSGGEPVIELVNDSDDSVAQDYDVPDQRRDSVECSTKIEVNGGGAEDELPEELKDVDKADGSAPSSPSVVHINTPVPVDE